MYATVADFRAEGVTPAAASDARLEALIGLATEYIERVTGRFFEARQQTLTLDGTGGRSLLLGHPIIRVDEVFIELSVFAPADVAVDVALYRVYNRHLTQGLLLPDDRDNPKLEFIHSSDLLGVSIERPVLSLSTLIWPKGQQNVLVKGVFGYTERDGSPTGRTPLLIRHLTMLLVLRELTPLTDVAGREEASKRWRITSERTRDQSYTLEAIRATGAFTGDPEIDAPLSRFVRPPDLGAA